MVETAIHPFDHSFIHSRRRCQLVVTSIWQHLVTLSARLDGPDPSRALRQFPELFGMLQELLVPRVHVNLLGVL